MLSENQVDCQSTMPNSTLAFCLTLCWHCHEITNLYILIIILLLISDIYGIYYTQMPNM